MEIKNVARILIVDDAVVVGWMVAKALSPDPKMDVVGMPMARSPSAKIPQVNPDVILLDPSGPEKCGK